jgi:translation elongation factor EF-Tu-like GTPase
MPIDNIFSVTGQGTVVTGTTKKGTMTKGCEAEIVGSNQELKTQDNGSKVFKKGVSEGDNEA